MVRYMIVLLLIFFLFVCGCELFEEEEETFDYPTITKIKIIKIPVANENGYAWDDLSQPDIYCTATNEQNNIYYTSNTYQDAGNSEYPVTFNPDNFELKDNERDLYIEVYDEDLTSDDLIGTVGPFSAQLIMDDSSNVYTMENYTWTLEVSVTLRW